VGGKEKKNVADQLVVQNKVNTGWPGTCEAMACRPLRNFEWILFEEVPPQKLRVDWGKKMTESVDR